MRSVESVPSTESTAQPPRIPKITQMITDNGLGQASLAGP